MIIVMVLGIWMIEKSLNHRADGIGFDCHRILVGRAAGRR
jgi:hypothetical protein